MYPSYSAHHPRCHPGLRHQRTSLREFGRVFLTGLPCAVCTPVSNLDFPLLPSALCSPFSHSYGHNYFKRQTRTCLSSSQTLASALYSEQSQGQALASLRDLRCVPSPPTPLLPGLVYSALFLFPSAQGSLVALPSVSTPCLDLPAGLGSALPAAMIYSSPRCGIVFLHLFPQALLSSRHLCGLPQALPTILHPTHLPSGSLYPVPCFLFSVTFTNSHTVYFTYLIYLFTVLFPLLAHKLVKGRLLGLIHSSSPSTKNSV